MTTITRLNGESEEIPQTAYDVFFEDIPPGSLFYIADNYSVLLKNPDLHSYTNTKVLRVPTGGWSGYVEPKFKCHLFQLPLSTKNSVPSTRLSALRTQSFADFSVKLGWKLRHCASKGTPDALKSWPKS